MDIEVKGVLDAQATAFEALKATLEETKGKVDGLDQAKIDRIEKSLDTAVEAKTALEGKIAAETKAREELEAQIGRLQLTGLSEKDAKAEIELKEFNLHLKANASERRRDFTPLDADGLKAYREAQVKMIREGKENLTPDEVKTLSVGSDPDGGYFVTADMSGRVARKVYESSPIRQIASVQVISIDALEGMEDLDEAGAGYAGERAVSGNTDTPQVGKWRIPVHWIDTEPKTTQQLLDDAAVDVEGWLSGKVGDKFARFENSEFCVGATKIRGLTSYTTAADDGSGVTWGSIGHVVSGASADFASSNPGDKIFDLIGCLKEAYLSNARFLTRRSVITKIRKFKDGQGNYLWQPSFVLGQPETIAGYAVTRAEDMPALAADSLSLAFGDFREAYQIVDRQGIRVLRDNLTSKPYVKFYSTKRVGGGVVNFEAMKVMKFNT